MRLFTALSLPEPQVAALLRRQGQLREHLRAGRFLPAASLHLTVHFLGEQPASRLPDLASVLGAAAASRSPFELVLGEAGQFPARGRPRVLWQGLAGDLPALQSLELSARLALAGLGVPLEARPYHPHVTLVREPSDRPPFVPLDPTPPWIVTELVLFSSETRPEGARYTALQRHVLGGAR